MNIAAPDILKSYKESHINWVKKEAFVDTGVF